MCVAHKATKVPTRVRIPGVCISIVCKVGVKPFRKGNVDELIDQDSVHWSWPAHTSCTPQQGLQQIVCIQSNVYILCHQRDAVVDACSSRMVHHLACYTLNRTAHSLRNYTTCYTLNHMAHCISLMDNQGMQCCKHPGATMRCILEAAV